MIRSRPPLIPRLPAYTSFALLVQAVLSVNKSFSAGGLPLEAEALAFPRCQFSSPLSPHACLYVGSLWCILLGGLPGAVSPELWVAQMGERATVIYETQRPPCVLDRQTDRQADLSHFISFTKKLEKNKAKQLILSDQYSERTEIIAFFFFF